MSDPAAVDRRIQRLIDGELDQTEQQRLLETLDGEPRLWRDVALGFVESELLRRELLSWRPAAETTGKTSPAQETSPPVAPPQPARSGLFSKAVTIAAAAIAAFVIGIAARHWWPMDSPARPSNGGTIASGERPLENKPAVEMRRGVDVADPDEGIRRISLPVLPADRVDPQSLSGVPVISAAVKVDLQRRGHVVLEERRFYCVKLKDGRHVLVPVREIRLQSLGSKVIQ